MRSKYPGLSELDARKALGAFTLGGNVALQTIRTLSGGQKSRLVLASVAWGAPHVLLLDEPTNHLDIESVTALQESLESFPGAVVFVSHDQNFIGSAAKELWVVKAGKVLPFEGSIWDYVKSAVVTMSAD